MKKLIIALLCTLLLTSCAGKPVATVGDIKITKSEFEFYLESIKNQMYDTELQTDEDWQNKEIEGKKAIDLAKEKAMDNAVKNALYVQAAEKAGLVLTNEDKKAIENTKQQLITGYGSQKAYNNFLKEHNITDDFIEMMCKSSVYYNKIGELVKNESNISDSDLEKYFNENKSTFESEIRKAKHILIATKNTTTNLDKTPEEREEAKKLANEILERAKSGEDFDALMNKYSEDPGLAKSPDGYVFGSGEMVPEFEEATDSVGFSEIAFCESEYGFHIIKRLPITFADVKENVKSDYMGKLIDKKVEEWKEKYSIDVIQNENVLSEIK